MTDFDRSCHLKKTQSLLILMGGFASRSEDQVDRTVLCASVRMAIYRMLCKNMRTPLFLGQYRIPVFHRPIGEIPSGGLK